MMIKLLSVLCLAMTLISCGYEPPKPDVRVSKYAHEKEWLYVRSDDTSVFKPIHAETAPAAYPEGNANK